MVYSIIRWLTRFTLKAYFRKVVVKGKENIPTVGPVIFVANHPSAFMDPMVIGIYAGRSLHFVAAAEFMGRGLRSWFYRKQLHMIPVYRPTTTTGDTSKMNKEMFAKSYELLARGGALVIFPEGNSITEKRLRKLKTGTARIALGTRDHSEGVEVSIVPVGLNYSNPHRFQSEVFVNIGEPVTTKGFASDQEGAVALTDEIERQLKKTVIHVEHEELDSVIKKAELIMKSRPGLQAGKASAKSASNDDGFTLHQRLIQSMQTVHEDRPDMIQEIEMRLDAYLGKIRQMGISDRAIAELSPIDTPLERIRLILGRPVFIVGFLINALPYYLTVFVFRRLNIFQRDGASPEEHGVNGSFRGSIAIAIGMVVFLLWYLGWAVASAMTTGLWWVALVASLIFYLTGLFTLRYIGWTMIADQKSRIRKLLTKGSYQYSDLVLERREIFQSIDSMTQEFQTN